MLTLVSVQVFTPENDSLQGFEQFWSQNLRNPLIEIIETCEEHSNQSPILLHVYARIAFCSILNSVGAKALRIARNQYQTISLILPRTRIFIIH